MNDDQDPIRDDDRGKRPWFGPKRVGMGVRPQTWQGYLIVFVVVVIIVIAVDVMTRR